MEMDITSEHFGLSSRILADIRRTLAACPDVEVALIFGSRGRGDFAASSDIDLAVAAPKLTDAEFAQLCAALEAIPMIFKLDIVRLDNLQNAPLADAIRRDGQLLLSRDRVE